MRLDPQVLDGIRRWADDELRSVNGQLEYLLRKALKDAGRTAKQEDLGKGKKEDKSKAKPKRKG